MKSHQIETVDNNIAKLQAVYKTQLQKQFNIGFSYGSQAFVRSLRIKSTDLQVMIDQH